MKIFEHAKSTLPTKWGTFDIWCFKDMGKEHIVLVKEPLSGIPLLRIHSECLTGDALGSLRCDCQDQLHTAFSKIADEKCGMLIYLRQEGRGIGLFNKISAYSLQDEGLDTVDANLKLGFQADERDYSLAAQMLEFFNVKEVRLLTNNPHKVQSLEKSGITVSSIIPLIIKHPLRSEYLQTKSQKLGHFFNQNSN